MNLNRCYRCAVYNRRPPPCSERLFRKPRNPKSVKKKLLGRVRAGATDARCTIDTLFREKRLSLGEFNPVPNACIIDRHLYSGVRRDSFESYEVGVVK